MNRLLEGFSVALLGLLSLTPLSSAQQCPRPDGLDGGPCCEVAQRRLPKLPALEDITWDFCWRDCDLAFETQCVASWSKPNNGLQQQGCGPLSSRLLLTDTAGVVKWRGRMRLQYSRTWAEFPAAGAEPVQVWRFLVNGDLKPTDAAGTVPCPVPPCAQAFGRARFTGYIDYAYKCESGEFSNAVWMLTHACDQFEHQQGFPRAGAFHPDFSYSFVGPASQFTPSPIVPTEGGGGPFEAVRRVDLTTVPGTVPAPRCNFEEQIQHQLQPQGQFCACSPAGNLPQFLFANLDINGVCGTSVHTTPASVVPGFVSMGLGRWGDPTKYPGTEALRWNTGGYLYIDGCTGDTRDEVFFGVSTIGGWDAVQVQSFGLGAPLPLTFIDQSNSLRQHQTIMNVPYVSDHFLNLNH